MDLSTFFTERIQSLSNLQRVLYGIIYATLSRTKVSRIWYIEEKYKVSLSLWLNLAKAVGELGQAADEVAGEYDDSVTEQAEWLSEALKQFANGICIAAKDRNQDYLKVLSSLLPKTPTAPKKPEKNKETKKDEEEQPAEPDENNTEDNAEEVEDNTDNNSNNE